MPFAVPMVWRGPRNHVDDCCFRIVNISGFSVKNKRSIQYSNLDSARRPVKHDKSSSIIIWRTIITGQIQKIKKWNILKICPVNNHQMIQSTNTPELILSQNYSIKRSIRNSCIHIKRKQLHRARCQVIILQEKKLLFESILPSGRPFVLLS